VESLWRLWAKERVRRRGCQDEAGKSMMTEGTESLSQSTSSLCQLTIASFAEDN
jgi:hypothetical protein